MDTGPRRHWSPAGGLRTKKAHGHQHRPIHQGRAAASGVGHRLAPVSRPLPRCPVQLRGPAAAGGARRRLRVRLPAGGHPRCPATPPASSTWTGTGSSCGTPRPRCRDFLDEEEVESRYVPELVELVLRRHRRSERARVRHPAAPPRVRPAADDARRAERSASPARRVGCTSTTPRRSGRAALRKGAGGPAAAPALRHRERVALHRPGAGARHAARGLRRAERPRRRIRSRPSSATPTGPGRFRWSATGRGTSGHTCPRCGGTRCSSSSSTTRRVAWRASCPTPPSTIRRCRPTLRRARASRRGCLVTFP